MRNRGIETDRLGRSRGIETDSQVGEGERLTDRLVRSRGIEAQTDGVRDGETDRQVRGDTWRQTG